MTEREKRQDDPAHEADDHSAEFVRELAETPPAKSIETMKAASDAVEKADKEKRDAGIRERAYHLWVEHGRPAGREDEFWHMANAEHDAHAAAEKKR